MKKFKFDYNYILIGILGLFAIVLFFANVKYFTVIVGIIMLVSMIFYIRKETYNTKCSVSNLFFMIFLSLWMIPTSFFMIVAPFKEPIYKLLNVTDDVVADGFTIEGYMVTLDVKKDNKVDVTEMIEVNFYEDGHHGIYKNTPFWLEYTGKDGKTIKRKSDIIDYRAELEKYVVSKVNGKYRVKIGDENKTVSGTHAYIIKYTYDMGSDPFDGFDEFIFHAFGDYWGTRIKNPVIMINMPEDIGDANINVFKDKYRKNNVNELVKIARVDNIIYITAENLNLTKSLTVDIELQDNYFSEGTNTYGYLSLIISIIVIIVTLYIIYMWIMYGKDREKGVPTIEFYPPDNLSSAEIGYIYNNCKSSTKLTAATIVELASKGFIRIDEIKGKRKKDNELQLTNLKPNAFVAELARKYSTKESDELDNNQTVVKKLNGHEKLSRKEKKVYNALFSDNSYIKIVEDDNYDFDLVKDNLVNKGYIEVLKNKTNIKIENDLFPENEIVMYTYKTLLKNGPTVLNENRDILNVFSETDKMLKEKFSEKVYDPESRNKKIISFILSSLLLFLSVVSFFDIEALNPKISYFYDISFICVLVDFILSFVMSRKTTYGETVKAKIRGFKEFLETAEKAQLESLVESNPNYFYDILPYTYVLNISKKWISKFNDIKIPEKNMGNIDISGGDAIFNSILSNSPSVGAFSGGGGGSSGGGCGSGGGCSSCGGGGSW